MTCENPNCRFAETGECYRELEPQDCPDLSGFDSAEGPLAAPTVAGQYLSLPSGDCLDVDAAASLARNRITRVIAILGERDTGKTTLMSSIINRFQRGPFAGFSFAGSRSLVAFERRCFLARLASGRTTADTERTKVGFDDGYLHLSVGKLEHGGRGGLLRELLFTDISGERCKAARQTREGAESLSVLRRADRVAILVDASSLADAETRHNVARNTRSLIRLLVETALLDARSSVDVVFSKWDRVITNPPTSVEDLMVDLKEKFTDRVGQLSFKRVAARPEKPSQYPDHSDFEELFRLWVEESALSRRIAPDVPAEPIAGGREYERFRHE